VREGIIDRFAQEFLRILRHRPAAFLGGNAHLDVAHQVAQARFHQGQDIVHEILFVLGDLAWRVNIAMDMGAEAEAVAGVIAADQGAEDCDGSVFEKTPFAVFVLLESSREVVGLPDVEGIVCAF
jgi:hypothetical protein